MKRITAFVLLTWFVVMASGCGETIRGIGRDATRVMHGTRTIFVSQN